MLVRIALQRGEPHLVRGEGEGTEAGGIPDGAGHVAIAVEPAEPPDGKGGSGGAPVDDTGGGDIKGGKWRSRPVRHRINQPHGIARERTGPRIDGCGQENAVGNTGAGVPAHKEYASGRYLGGGEAYAVRYIETALRW